MQQQVRIVCQRNLWRIRSSKQASMTPKVNGIRDRYVALAYRMRKSTRYARTVKRGESPLMVWTNDTGIFDVAMELRIWPAN